MPFTSRTRAQAKEMLREGGSSDRAIAQRFGVDPASIRALRAELRADGVKVAKPRRGRPRKGARALDAAYLAVVEHVLDFERQGFPEAMSIEMSLAMSIYSDPRAYPHDRGSASERIVKATGKAQSVAALALTLRIFGYLGSAEEPREEVHEGIAPKSWRLGCRRNGGRWKRIAYEPMLWRPASWESCGEFVRHRLLKIEPPAIFDQKPDGSNRLRKGWQELQEADQKESAKMGGKLRRTLRATLPLLKQHGHDPSDLRRLLAMRLSPRRGA
jgi:hypothetical protein